MAHFQSCARLLKPVEFKATFESGKRLHQSWYIAVVHPQAQNTSAPQPATGKPCPGARLGLAIAKKRVAQASQRNRLKREIRESFRLHRERLPSVDIVILVKPEIRAATAQQRRQQLSALWLRIQKLAPVPLPAPSAAG